MKVDKFFKDVDEEIMGFCYEPAMNILEYVHKTKCGRIDFYTPVEENHKELLHYFRTIARLNGDRQGWLLVEHWLTRSGKYMRYGIRDGFYGYTEDLKEFFLDESR